MSVHVPPRIYRRVPFKTAVRLQFERFRGFIEEFSANLSLGGMFIRTQDPPEVGTELPIEFRLGEDYELIKGRGRVAWVRREAQGPEHPAGMGIRFLELTPGSRELIFKMVERRVREGGEAFDLEAEADLLPDRPFETPFDGSSSGLDGREEEPAPASEQEPDPEPAPEPEPEPAPEPEPEPAPEPEPDPASEPASAPEPEPAREPQPDLLVAPQSEVPPPSLRPRKPDTGPYSEQDLLASVTPSRDYALRESGTGVAKGQEDDTGSPRRILFILLPLCLALVAAAWLLRDRYLPAPEPVDTGPTVLWDAELQTDETAVPAAEGAGAETEQAAQAARADGGQTAAPAAVTTSPPTPPAAAGRVSRVEDVTWTSEGSRTVLVVWTDAPLAAEDFVDFRLDGGAPRHVVRILGVAEPYARGRLTVGTEQVERLRTGLHTDRRPSELHLVLDLARGDAEVRLEPVGNRLRIVVEGAGS